MCASEPTLMRLVIASSTSAHHVVQGYHEAIRRLPLERFQVEHIGLTTDDWYAGNARAAYSALGCAVLDVPRPSGAATPWWQAHDIYGEFESAVPIITETIQNLVQEQRPTLLLLADDTGPLEVLLIKLFEAASIPIVLIEHGPDFIFQQDNESRLTLNRLVRRLKRAVQQRFQPRRAMPAKSSGGKNRVRENLRPKPFGHNGNYLICTYSKLSSRLLIKHGISAERIRDTGYPYYDLAVRSRSDPLRSRSSKRILIVSTGWGLFGRTEAARRYYRVVIELCRRVSPRHTLVFRFKPGERRPAAYNDLLGEIGNFGVQFDDGDIAFHEAIQDYDLVLGESSGALIEAVIARKPAVLLDYNDGFYYRGDWSMGRMLLQYLELLRLRDPSQAEEIISQALSAVYAEHLSKQLLRYEDFLLNKVDGNAGLRVSQVLLETICARVEAERVRRSGSSRDRFMSVGHPASLEKVRARYRRQAAMNVSVVIPTYNRATTVMHAVRSAAAADYPSDCYEIIVVDNASTDATPQVVKNLQGHVNERILRYVLEKQLGLHNARHAGARAAKGEILVFTDDDATFDPGWLKAYANAFEAHPQMVAAGGPVRPVWEVPPPRWLIELMGDSKRLNILSLMDSYQEFRLDQKGLFFGVNMAIRRNVLFQVGGFNPEVFGDVWLGDGETGLNRKLWERGMLVGYVPDAVVYHHIPAQRMTIDYFCHRMSNEGACAMYARFHRGLPHWLNLCTYAAATAIKNSKYLVGGLLANGRTDSRSLRMRLQASRTKSQLRYVLRLMHDNDLRKLVVKEDWLNE